MVESRKHDLTLGVRGRVVDKAIQNALAKQTEISTEFAVELRKLLSAERVPKADAYLQLFEKQVSDEQ